MPYTKLEQALTLFREFKTAVEEGDEGRSEAISELEKQLMWDLSPEERLQYNLVQMSHFERKPVDQLNAELEEMCHSKDPGIKAGFIEGYMKGMSESMQAFVGASTKSSNDQLGDIGEHLEQIRSNLGKPASQGDQHDLIVPATREPS